MKLVIFDCDGTLVDSQRAIVATMNEAFTGLGLVPPARSDVLAIVGLSLPEALAVLAPDRTVAVRSELTQRYRAAFAAARLANAQDEPLFPGAREAISGLGRRSDVALGIATGKSRRGVRRLLDREGWHTQFRTIQTADDHPSKPHPAMLLAAMAETGIAPEAAVMVGDTTFDMAMARQAGVYAVGVAWGYHPTERLREAGAQRIIAAFDDLPAVIDGRRAKQGMPS
ncbi:MAG: HAD-IA family hydrolase [Hyphomicrobiaceae bacterium]